MDELLPVPVTLQPHHSPDSQHGVKGSILRIGSVGVIIVFLLTITFYGTAVIGTIDGSSKTHSSMKGVIGSLVSSLQGSLKGVEDKMESLNLGGEGEPEKSTLSPPSDIWDDTELSDIQVQPTDGTVYGLTREFLCICKTYFAHRYRCQIPIGRDIHSFVPCRRPLSDWRNLQGDSFLSVTYTAVSVR